MLEPTVFRVSLRIFITNLPNKLNEYSYLQYNHEHVYLSLYYLSGFTDLDR